ncbi:3786_t:CDS:2 [Dentiscutata heterogama]|uniref:3786_t:CDS:1 n=1 Tax=Dentiscutata heterogama TaxID=1316150 RepID=A0ACA9KHF3_9GLOM|nr:3786_t:CDS:2 [Dentiscutata heterogama]
MFERFIFICGYYLILFHIGGNDRDSLPTGSLTSSTLFDFSRSLYYIGLYGGDIKLF